MRVNGFGGHAPVSWTMKQSRSKAGRVARLKRYPGYRVPNGRFRYYRWNAFWYVNGCAFRNLKPSAGMVAWAITKEVLGQCFGTVRPYRLCNDICPSNTRPILPASHEGLALFVFWHGNVRQWPHCWETEHRVLRPVKSILRTTGSPTGQFTGLPASADIRLPSFDGGTGSRRHAAPHLSGSQHHHTSEEHHA